MEGCSSKIRRIERGRERGREKERVSEGEIARVQRGKKNDKYSADG